MDVTVLDNLRREREASEAVRCRAAAVKAGWFQTTWNNLNNRSSPGLYHPRRSEDDTDRDRVDDRIVDLKHQGHSYRAIADMIGITADSVKYRYRKKVGLGYA